MMVRAAQVDPVDKSNAELLLLCVESVQPAWGCCLARVSLTGHHLATSDPSILAVWLQACSNWQRCSAELVRMCVGTFLAHAHSEFLAFDRRVEGCVWLVVKTLGVRRRGPVWPEQLCLTGRRGFGLNT